RTTLFPYTTLFRSKEEKALVEKLLFPDGKKLNAVVVGQSAFDIAKMAGFSVSPKTNILAVNCSTVGEVEPLTREKLSPVLAVLKSKNFDEGLYLSEKMVELDGLGHSAVIHTNHKPYARAFGLKLKAIRIIENSPA